MGQGKSFDKSSSLSLTKDGRHLHTRLEAIKKPFEVVDPLIPNGLFPPEILELILMHLDPPSLAKVIISCKLWLQTSAHVFQHTYKHRYVLPPNIDLSTFNAREEVFKQHLIEQQMAKGNCWVQVLSQDYDSGRSRTSFQHKWSHYGNIIALTKEKVHHSSYGSSTSLDQTCLIDMGAHGVDKQDVYGVHVVGGVRVVPKATQFADWNWEEVRCFVNENEDDSFIIVRKNKFVRNDLNDPWHTLRTPARMMTGLANLDGSAQLLIYDRNTSMGDSLDTFMIEVWNVTNGNLIHEIKLDQVGDDVVGFYKHFAIMSLKETDETVFVNLTSGLVEKSFPHQSKKHSFCLFDNRIAFITDSEVSAYHYETAELIKKININIFKTEQPFKFTGVSLDKWKLVVSTRVTTQKYHRYYEQSNGFVAIFDITRDFTLLCTKYIASLGMNEVKLACLPNGSVVIGDKALMVLDFIHPYLEKPMSVVVFTGSSTVQVTKINPLDLGKFASETFKCKLGDLDAITYYEVPEKDAPRPKTDHYSWDESYKHLKDKIRRITFVCPTLQTLTDQSKQVEGTITPNFSKFWRKHTDTIAPFTFSSNDVNEKPNDAPQNSRRASAFNGASIMVFEKFNQKTQRWEITEPFVPKGINIDIEFDV